MTETILTWGFILIIISPLPYTIYKILTGNFVKPIFIILSTVSAVILFSFISVLLFKLANEPNGTIGKYSIPIFIITSTIVTNRWLRQRNRKLKKTDTTNE